MCLEALAHEPPSQQEREEQTCVATHYCRRDNGLLKLVADVPAAEGRLNCSREQPVWCATSACRCDLGWLKSRTPRVADDNRIIFGGDTHVLAKRI